MLPEAIDDGLFVFAPSMLVEGKAIGTAKHADLVLTKNLQTPANVSAKEHAKVAKIGVTVGRKKLGEVQSRTRLGLISLFVNFNSSKLTVEAFRTGAQELMREAWRDSFIAGIRAAGIPGSETGHGKLDVPSLLPAADEAWLKSAMAHEMTFFNGFLGSLVEGTGKMPPLRRIEMYVDALTSFYESARVIGLPNTVLLWWSGPHDKRSCAGCRFLREESPFTKFTLPTTPRAGMTPCLSNCRDRILVRRAGIDEVAATVKAAKYTRAGFMATLRRIKRTGAFPGG